MKKPKCRVNWDKPCRAGTVCNYVDEVTNECKQVDWKRCPCGGIVRYPRFEGMPWNERDRIVATSDPCTDNGCTDTEDCDEICQHSRIYSPAQMQEAENKRVLQAIFDWLFDGEGGDIVFNAKLGLYSVPENFDAVGLIHKLYALKLPAEPPK
jgi:hypothetical protein